jgi:hypothetical protein
MTNCNYNSKPNRLRYFKEGITYPLDTAVYVKYGKDPKQAHIVRNEIETKWSKFGKWVGHGSAIYETGECDVQVGFKTSQDLTKAKKIAQTLADKYKVKIRITVHKYTRKELLDMYELKEKEV